MSKDTLRSLLYPDPVTEELDGKEVTFNFRLPTQAETTKHRRDLSNSGKEDPDAFVDLFYAGPLALTVIWGDGERLTLEQASWLTTILPPDSKLVAKSLKLCGMDKVEQRIKENLKKTAEELEAEQQKQKNLEDDSPLE